MPGKTEQVEPVVEQETKGESKTDLLDKAFAELATASPEEAKASTESPERETESEEEEEKEESFEDKVIRLAQSMKDKELKPVYKELNDLRAKSVELEKEAKSRSRDRHFQKLFHEEVEDLGEDEAKVAQRDREKWLRDVENFENNTGRVEAILAKLGDANLDEVLKDMESKTLAEGIKVLNFNLRDWKVKKELWTMVFPEDKAKVAQVDAYLKKFEKAKDWDDCDLILEGIRESVKGKNKFVPDSSQGGGGGRIEIDLSKPDAARKLMERGYRKKK